MSYLVLRPLVVVYCGEGKIEGARICGLIHHHHAFTDFAMAADDHDDTGPLYPSSSFLCRSFPLHANRAVVF